MSTPVFNSALTALGTVRYYTALDAYHYTIDNRPLGDLASNDGISSYAADAARRATLVESVAAGVRTQNTIGTVRYVQGLDASSPASNTLRIGVGSIFDPLAISAGDARVLMKQGIRPYYTDFAINTVTISGAQSVIYAIEARIVDFSGSTTNTFPFYDNTNTYLPATLFPAELQLQITPGVAATTGAEAAPAVTGGWFQLYLVTVNGATPTTYSLIQYPSSATFNSWGLTQTMLSLSNITSTTVAVGDTPTTSFASGSTQGAFTSVPLITNAPVPVYNPYKPLKFKLLYTAGAATGNVSFRVKYKFLGSADAVTPATYTTSSTETIAVTASIGNMATYSTATAIVPSWGAVGKERVNLVFERVTGDTMAGAFNVISIQAFQ